MDNSALLKEFLIESFENLNHINEELTRFEKNPSDQELLNQIYRSVHTLKGSASFLGYKKLQELTHHAENVLDALREKTILINQNIADVLLESFDLSITFLKSIESTGKEEDLDPSSLVQKLQKLLQPTEIEGGGHLKDDNLLELNPHDLQISEPVEVPPVSLSVVEPTEVKEKPIVHRMNEKEDHPAAAAAKAGDDSDSKKNIADSVVRVNVNLLEKIMNVVGELVLNRNQILQFANGYQNSELSRLTQQLNVITTELQTDIMTTRMQPIGSILTKYERVVRDIAKEMDKKISLRVSGQETELDKTLIEAIKDPLTHIIRNAADHGLERTDIRVARGKSEEGHIDIRAFHEGGQVIIEIVDDGAGIDSKKILAKAIEKGIVSPDSAGSMSEEKILALIFAPGFSTAEKITNISGRGVGMDVVRTNIEKIGGQVSISTKVGEGTSFKLKIPLTLAIIPALIVQGMGESFALSQTNLVELVRLDKSKKNRIEKVYGGQFLRLREKLIPLLNLNDVLKLSNVKERNLLMMESVDDKNLPVKSKEGFQLQGNNEDEVNIVILNAEGHVYGLIVDHILDTEEIVVKPLGKYIETTDYFAGATIMGDGKVALIIDVLGLYHKVEGDKPDAAKENGVDDESHKNVYSELHENLLFELNDGRFYAIPLSIVNRLEEISETEIEYTGDQAVIRYLDGIMPILDLSEVMKATKFPYNPGPIPCIVAKIYGKFFGFRVRSIQDICTSSADINSEVIDRPEIMGTIFINNKTVTVVDLFKVLKNSMFAGKWKSLGNQKLMGKKILVVEDSPMYRQMEESMLRDCGCEVVTANDGAEGFDVLNSGKKFDIIITDIEMPKMNGHEMAKKIKDDGRFNHIPIIAVTTKVSKKDFELSEKIGIRAHLEKFKKDQIIEILEQCVEEAS